MSGIKATRVVKFIRKGDKGSDAVRYWLIPSVSTVVLSNIADGDGTPSPKTVSCRLVKQIGDDSPTTITTPSSVGLTMSYSTVRNNVVSPKTLYTNGNISVPTNTAYTAIEFYLYQGSTLIDTATIAITRDGEQGEPGQDGVIYDVELSPAAIYVAANGSTQTAEINATAYKTTGVNRVAATDGVMYLSFVKEDNTTSRVVSNGLVTNGALSYKSVVFEYEVSKKVVAKTALQINKEGQPGTPGSKGDRGPTLRGPQAWSDCVTGYCFQAGGTGEAWKDVVLYGDNYYSCIKSHTKTASNYPGSTADQNNKYWQLGDKIELVATKILLATYALVKNLGVECIDMRDASGNVLFQAKDGNVTCKTGTFTNIKVTGDITAEYLNLKTSTAAHYPEKPALANGAICNGASGIILPELPQGTARSMRVLNPLLTRTVPLDLVLKPASTKVLISKSLSWIGAVNSTVTLEGRGYNAGFYLELIGVREANSDYTYWLMSEMTPGLTS